MGIVSLIRYDAGVPILLPDDFRHVHHLPGPCRYLTLEFLPWGILIVQLFLLRLEEKGMPVFKGQKKEKREKSV